MPEDSNLVFPDLITCTASPCQRGQINLFHFQTTVWALIKCVYKVFFFALVVELLQLICWLDHLIQNSKHLAYGSTHCYNTLSNSGLYQCPRKCVNSVIKMRLFAKIEVEMFSNKSIQKCCTNVLLPQNLSIPSCWTLLALGLLCCHLWYKNLTLLNVVV